MGVNHIVFHGQFKIFIHKSLLPVVLKSDQLTNCSCYFLELFSNSLSSALKARAELHMPLFYRTFSLYTIISICLFIVAMYVYKYIHQQMFSALSYSWLLFLAGGQSMAPIWERRSVKTYKYSV